MPTHLPSCRSPRRTWPALAFLALTLAAVAARADIGSWGVLGPPSPYVQGNFLSVVTALIDPTNPAVFYAGTLADGVYKSTDGGYSWVFRGPISSGAGLFSDCLAFDPTTSATIYDGTYGDVYKTTDGGANWTFIPRAAAAEAYAVLATSSSIAFSSTPTSAFYKTTDGGANWNAAGSAGSSSIRVLALDSSVLFAGTTDGVYRSSNAGTGWNLSGCGNGEPASPPIHALVVDPTSSGTVLYAGTDGAGIYKSDPGVITGCVDWTSASAGLPASSIVLALAIDSAAPNTLYAGTDGGGVFKTTDGGTSWTGLANGSLPNLHIDSLMLDPSAHSRLYAGTKSVPSTPLGLYHLQQDVATSFYSLTPCRLVNTAGGAPLGGGALAAQTTRSFSLADVGTCGVPKNAIALSLNITAVNPSSGGNLKIYAPGTPTPTATALSMRAGRTLANNAIVTVGSGATMVVFDNQPSGTVGLIVDVNGYLAP